MGFDKITIFANEGRELNSVLRWCLSILLMAVQSGSYYLVEVGFLRAKYDDVLGHLLVGLEGRAGQGSEGVLATPDENVLRNLTVLRCTTE